MMIVEQNLVKGTGVSFLIAQSGLADDGLLSSALCSKHVHEMSHISIEVRLQQVSGYNKEAFLIGLCIY